MKTKSESSRSAEHNQKKSADTQKVLTAEEFDRRFDEGEELDEYFDHTKASRPNLQTRRVNIDINEGMLRGLDQAAEKRGIARQALIKSWLFEQLRAEKILE